MKFAAVLLVLYVLYLATPTQGTQCYLCRPGSALNSASMGQQGKLSLEDPEDPTLDPEDLKKQKEHMKNAPFCSDGDRDSWKYECPPSFNGCALAIHPAQGTVRVCDFLHLKDTYCTIDENEVIECKCSTDLCNTEKSDFPKPIKPIRPKPNDPTKQKPKPKPASACETCGSAFSPRPSMFLAIVTFLFRVITRILN